MGERGGLAIKVVERVPLAQAEDKLRRAVKALLDADGKAGFFRKQLQAELISKIEAVTLASFRKEGTKQGGLDLMEVRKQLQTDLDKRLEEIFSSARIVSTAIMLLVAAGVSLYLAFLVRFSAR